MSFGELKHIRLSHRLENKNTLCIDLYLGSIPAQMLDFLGMIAKIASRRSRNCRNDSDKYTKSSYTSSLVGSIPTHFLIYYRSVGRLPTSAPLILYNI